MVLAVCVCVLPVLALLNSRYSGFFPQSKKYAWGKVGSDKQPTCLGCSTAFAQRQLELAQAHPLIICWSVGEEELEKGWITMHLSIKHEQPLYLIPSTAIKSGDPHICCTKASKQQLFLLLFQMSLTCPSGHVIRQQYRLNPVLQWHSGNAKQRRVRLIQNKAEVVHSWKQPDNEKTYWITSAWSSLCTDYVC